MKILYLLFGSLELLVRLLVLLVLVGMSSLIFFIPIFIIIDGNPGFLNKLLTPSLWEKA